jgi:hypothetical protein
MVQQPLVGQGPKLHDHADFTLDRIPLIEWSARRTDLYLATLKHSQETTIPSAVFEPAIPASERP